MPQSEGGYKLFKIGELFNIKKGKRLTKANMIEGNINFIGATSSNNGITEKIGNNAHLHPAGTISVTYNGSVGEAFYQTERFWASDDVNVLYPKISMNERTALFFLVPLIKKGKVYGYSFKWTKDKMEKDTIALPINKFGSIDFKYIEELIEGLQKEYIYKLEAYIQAAGLGERSLTSKERKAIQEGNSHSKSVRIVDFFTVTNSHNILKSDVVFDSGKTPYVTASEGNNSVVSYIDYKEDMKETGNSIMIGGKTLVITYQPTAFFSNDSHNLVLCAKEQQARRENIQLFLVASLYKSLKPKYNWGDSISKAKIQNDTFVLPMTPEGSVDYDFMDSYICAVKKQVIGGLLDFIRMGKETHS